MNAQDRVIWAQTGKGTRIGTAFDHVGALREGILSLVKWYARQAASIGFEFHAQPAGKVQAEINHGRWIVRCEVCGGAEEAAPQEPFFYCLSCGNAESGGHLMQVVFPDEREGIEALLLKREIENRNWRPGELWTDLAIENLMHDLEG